MPPNNYRSLTLSNPAYVALQRAREELMQRGIGAIPQELLDPPRCPCCAGSVEHVTIGIEHINCRSCGYTQQTASVGGNALAPFVAGVIVSAGIAALLMYMSDKAPKRTQARPAPSRAAPRRKFSAAPKKRRASRAH